MKNIVHLNPSRIRTMFHPYLYRISTRNMVFRRRYPFKTGDIWIHHDSIDIQTLANILPEVVSMYGSYFPLLSPDRVRMIQQSIRILNYYQLSPIRVKELNYDIEDIEKNPESCKIRSHLKEFLSGETFVIRDENNIIYQGYTIDSDKAVLMTLSFLLTYILECAYPPFTHTCCYHGVDKSLRFKGVDKSLRLRLETFHEKICLGNAYVIFRFHFIQFINKRDGLSEVSYMLSKIVKDQKILKFIKDMWNVGMLDKQWIDIMEDGDPYLTRYDMISLLLWDFYLTQLDVEYMRLYPKHNYVRNGVEVFISIPLQDEGLRNKGLDSPDPFSNSLESFSNYMSSLFDLLEKLNLNSNQFQMIRSEEDQIGSIEGSFATFFLDGKGVVTYKPNLKSHSCDSNSNEW